MSKRRRAELLLTLGDGLHFAVGDALCLLCSVSYGADIVITDRAVASPEVDPIGMSVVEIGATGVLFLLLSLLFERPHPRAYLGAAMMLLSLVLAQIDPGKERGHDDVRQGV